MSKTLLLVAALCAVLVAAVGASSAFAGEITGNGKLLWTYADVWGVPPGEAALILNGPSPCAFSGQEDDQSPGTVGEPQPALRPRCGSRAELGTHPQAMILEGRAGPAGCNPHAGFGEG